MVRERKRALIFTDLDGTLLDTDDYAFDEALPALEEIRKRRIPLVLCSSKTRAEIEFYQRKLEIDDPFVSENGGAIFIPGGYFDQVPAEFEERGKYLVLELGTAYPLIRRIFLDTLEKLKLKAVGFGDMTAEEVSSLLNLSQAEAKLAKRREYDEPFYFVEQVGENEIKLAEKEFNRNGLSLTAGGKLFHLTGDNDKGKAVELLSQLYKNNWGNDLLTIGLGDSPNDLPLLELMDVPVLVRKKDDSRQQNTIDRRYADVNHVVGGAGLRGKVHKTHGIGPRGWNEAVLDLIEKYEISDH